jgi:hypothetical protein
LSQREVPTSELMMIDRMFVAEEQVSLQQLKDQTTAAASAAKGEVNSEDTFIYIFIIILFFFINFLLEAFLIW